MFESCGSLVIVIKPKTKYRLHAVPWCFVTFHKIKKKRFCVFVRYVIITSVLKIEWLSCRFQLMSSCVRQFLITNCRKRVKNYSLGVSSNGVTFVVNSLKIGQLVETLKVVSHTQHGDFISTVFFILRMGIMLKIIVLPVAWEAVSRSLLQGRKTEITSTW
jgi:hypothetical protein